MGCFNSTPNKIGDKTVNNSVQDEARSFRSKTDAVRFITKNLQSRDAFRLYLEKSDSLEYFLCFLDVETIKSQPDDKMMTEVQTTLAKYEQPSSADDKSNNVKMIIWEKLRRFRALDKSKSTRKEVMSCVISVENQLLAELAVPFEGFLTSKFYKDWVATQMQSEKDMASSKKSPLTRNSSANRSKYCFVNILNFKHFLQC